MTFLTSKLVVLLKQTPPLHDNRPWKAEIHSGKLQPRAVQKSGDTATAHLSHL